MKNQLDCYENLLNIEKIEDVYHTIRLNSKHKDKIFVFELFFSCNVFSIYQMLRSRNYHHQKYNIFLLRKPKYRIIMSECMTDKIVNHLVSKYVLFPILEPRMIPMNVATRSGMGTEKGVYYIKKYIHHLKQKNEKFYVLKCDISKYFYSIDHDILFQKISKVIHDHDLLILMREIIDSTNQDYVNFMISSLIEDEITRLKNKSINLNFRIAELEMVPCYQFGKGLPIGNMTSQILAIYYLNDLDHFIKEKLHIKYYVRYMDDFILFHEDKKYLRFCYQEISKELAKLKLSFNKKTQIVEIHQGFSFLGYRFVLRDKRLLILLPSKSKKRIRRKLRYLQRVHPDNESAILASYRGYLKRCHSGSFLYRNHLK